MVPYVIDASQDCDGVHFKYLEQIRCVTLSTVEIIFRMTARPLRDLVQVTRLKDLHLTSLAPGHGLFITGDLDFPHAMAMWRGLDGDYFFFDSLSMDPQPLEVLIFLHHRTYYQYHYPLQAPHLRTCGYHCFAFLDFMTKHRQLHTNQVAYCYPTYPYLDLDVHVTKIGEEMLNEFKNSVLFRFPCGSDPPLISLVQDPVARPPEEQGMALRITKASRRRRNKRRWKPYHKQAKKLKV